eukprot:CAMPEP_0202866206 /NCGR_PEP_ID=MMETSP1391-20130828/7260_1 /ASSEMBLY_ACC=CAM_ASM_000867 /TAXON_ID=1034604 /ORGANISM="Chlamydomonas leiostraca, Strain SAG 11-49" /LENGTH=699 /DNA_ID=CAMNT_0049546135 /DNA_START=95 /DNA_END=2194 /DNA_ORIENTATION=-
MLPFALGTTAVVFPQVGLPVIGSLGAAKGIKSLVGRKKEAEAKKAWDDLAQLNRQVPPIVLKWDNINCNLVQSDGNTRRLLVNCKGQARPGRLLALMGPSGSGKTTLLNALAGQVPCSTSITLSGSLTINGQPSTESNHRQGYVQQEDVFYSQLTVMETMTMAAELRLPASMSKADKKAYVDRLIAVLGLTKAAHTIVGDAKVRGLSGGERKRLSLGCELIGSPPLIFLDEPTSGLDAAAAEKVMSTLKALARAGHTVVASIHQPRSSIWAMFDDLVLLHEGQVVYSGAAGEALEHFAALGHTCPPHHNPAEFVADLISADWSNSGNGEEDSAKGRARVEALVKAWATNGQQRLPSSPGQGPVRPDAETEAVHAGAGDALRPRTSFWRQFVLLAGRSWKQVTRDKAATIARIGSNVSSALIFGAIFHRMGRAQSSIQDRMGLMQVAAINTAMSSLIKTLNVFPRERTIVNRERAKHAYTTTPYLAAKLLAELPIGAVFPLLFGCVVYPLTGLNPDPRRFLRFLGIITLESFTSSALGLAVGSVAPTTEAAIALGPAVMLVWIVFGGYYVNAANVPRVLKWLPKASLIKQGFEALCVNEFKGAKFDLEANGRGMADGEAVLDWLSFGHTSIRKTLVQQARIMLVYYVATYAILDTNRPKFQPLEAPKQPAATGSGSNGAQGAAPATPTKAKQQAEAAAQP